MSKRPLRPTIKQTPAELEELEHSGNRFDTGRDAEAKRLAVVIRVLVHETGKSRSLLGQLGRKTAPFVDTAEPRIATDVSRSYHGLVSMAIPLPQVQLRRDYVAMLDKAVDGKYRSIPFDDWWNATVFSSPTIGDLTRRDLVLTVADQDGGAHVDAEIDEAYAKLARANALGWTRRETGKAPRAVRAPHLVAIRQIAHEVLKSFDLATRKPKSSKLVPRWSFRWWRSHSRTGVRPPVQSRRGLLASAGR